VRDQADVDDGRSAEVVAVATVAGDATLHEVPAAADRALERRCLEVNAGQRVGLWRPRQNPFSAQS
jgi:hypothetical protein